MRALNVTNLPIYLPYNKAPVPFGDPLSDGTATSASPGVFTVPGYNAPAAGDQVVFTASAGKSVPTGITAGTVYFVVSPSGGTFSVSATKGGAAINTSSTGSGFTTHLVSGETDGVTLAFKPGATVVVANVSGGSLTLQGANDLNAGFGNPGGPDTWNTIVTLGNGFQGAVTLNYDWIRVSTAATLTLLNN